MNETRGGVMRIAGSATSIILILAVVTACGSGEVNKSNRSASPSRRPSSSASGSPEAAAADVPNFVGMGLQSAQDKAQALGFYNLASHDSLGRGRNQLLDRDWKVCFQSPRPGEHTTATRIDFGTVKLEEQCPPKDGSEPTTTSGVMPNFTGKSVKAARDALDPSASISVEDASGEDRVVIVESNWKVCSQAPTAGTKLNGQPVTLKAVKFVESCP